jgi:predicted nuclease with TOPRIM domain
VYGGAQCTNGKIRRAEKVYDYLVMTKDDRWALREEIQELKEDAAALTDRAKKTARHAEVLSERIKHLQTTNSKDVLSNAQLGQRCVNYTLTPATHSALAHALRAPQ